MGGSVVVRCERGGLLAGFIHTVLQLAWHSMACMAR